MRIARRIGKYLAYYLSDPRNLFASERIGVTKDGIKHWCLRENHIERSILDTGAWEPAETNAVKRQLRPGDVAFDIGANIGYFTLLMSRLVGENGQVHGFEPTAYAFARLRRNLAINPDLPLNIRLNNKGLASCAGRKVEALEARFSSRLLAYDQEETIDFVTLDEYVSSEKLDRVSFVKIDVDGYDYEVMQGAQETLKRCKPTVMAELCNRVLEPRGISVGSYLELYLENGYTSCELLETGDALALKDLIGDPRIRTGSWNVLLS